MTLSLATPNLMSEGRRLMTTAHFALPEMPPQHSMSDSSPFDHKKSSSSGSSSSNLGSKDLPMHAPHTPQPFTASWLMEVARMTPMRSPSRSPFSDFYQPYQLLRSPFYPSFLSRPQYRQLMNYKDQIRSPDTSTPFQLVRPLGPPPVPPPPPLPLPPESFTPRETRFLTEHKELSSGCPRAAHPLCVNTVSAPPSISSTIQRFSHSHSNSKSTTAAAFESPTTFESPSIKKSALPMEPEVHSQTPFYSHFCKGSLIMLSDDTIKNIEDLETSDFIKASEMSEDLSLYPSKVGAITSNAEKNFSTILFTFPSHNKQASYNFLL